MPVGVIFDMDGVLVASGPAHAASWRVVARRAGIEVSDEQFKRLFGRPSRDIIKMLWGDGVTDAQTRTIDDEKEAAYRDLVTGMVPLTVGVRECLHGLREAGMPLAVATSGPPENVDLLLDEGRLRPYFEAIVTGMDVTHGKPAPDCFLLAAERIGLAAGACVVVEDAPVGIQAAKAAGTKVVALVGTHPAERLQQESPDRVVERLSDITPDLVTQLAGA